MAMKLSLLLGLCVLVLCTCGPPLHVHAATYKPKYHAQAAMWAAGLTKGSAAQKALKAGAKEPDAWGMGTMQMVSQFMFSRATKRNLMWGRVAAQHIHANGLPLTDKTTGGTPVTDAQKKLIASFESKYTTSNKGGLYSLVTNKQVRNKILLQGSHFACLAMAYPEDKVAYKYLGNFAHMFGDAFSASHVLRKPDDSVDDVCKNNTIQIIFSMDVVRWSRHAPADADIENWRFKCMRWHLKQMFKPILSARRKLTNLLQDAVPDADVGPYQEIADEMTKALVPEMCAALPMEREVLDLPSGGADRYYSSHSPAKASRKAKGGGDPVLPEGLASTEVFSAYVRLCADNNNKRGGYAYPTRASPDFCQPRHHMKLKCSTVSQLLRAMHKHTRKDMWTQKERGEYEFPNGMPGEHPFMSKEQRDSMLREGLLDLRQAVAFSRSERQRIGSKAAKALKIKALTLQQNKKAATTKKRTSSKRRAKTPARPQSSKLTSGPRKATKPSSKKTSNPRGAARPSASKKRSGRKSTKPSSKNTSGPRKATKPSSKLTSGPRKQSRQSSQKREKTKQKKKKKKKATETSEEQIGSFAAVVNQHLNSA